LFADLTHYVFRLNVNHLLITLAVCVV